MEVKNLLQIPLQEADLILLDLDNTLYDYSVCHHRALDKLVGEMKARFELSDTEIKSLYDRSRRNIHHRLHGTAVSHSRLFYIQEMVETLQGRTDIALIEVLYAVYWNSFIEKMSLFTDVIPFLDAVNKLNILNVLVTDMTAEIQFKKIHKLGIEKYLSFIVTSEEAGVEKPHPYIFERAVAKGKRIKSDLNHIILIGDDIKKDFYIPDGLSVATYNIIR